jgi:hypothetical protein
MAHIGIMRALNRGYDCSDHCSGHAAGYRWAEVNGITDESSCPRRGGANAPVARPARPCPRCNPSDEDAAPRPPKGFRTEFDKKGWRHVAAVALYVAHYNLCRIHEALKMTPAKAIGVADRVWAIGDLIDAALATQPITPVTTAPDRRKRFTVIEGGRK